MDVCEYNLGSNQKIIAQINGFSCCYYQVLSVK